MRLSFSNIENVEHIVVVSANSTYGVGLITAIVTWFCGIFGLECKMYDEKIQKAKSSAASQLIDKAKQIGATGIMDVRFQVTGTTVFMYGIAYK